MISFESDYTTGAHPQILRRLMETNLEPLSGYGTDRYCESARNKIRRACGLPDAQVEFLVGGTQTNSVVISTMLRDYEGVVAADTGHISTHEAGAIEYAGHKVLALPAFPQGGGIPQGEAALQGNGARSAPEKGKIDAAVLDSYIAGFYADGNHEHMVFPGMVYISHPTEYGTLYTRQELEALRAVCDKYEIPLFLDGARLGYGLMSRHTDVTLSDIARLCDVFYIGGTKVGALCGEAVVFTKNNRPPHFMNSVKKRGALLAKGRLPGIQFDTLFTDEKEEPTAAGSAEAAGAVTTASAEAVEAEESTASAAAGNLNAREAETPGIGWTLYGQIGRHAIEMAEEMKEIFREHGMRFYLDSPTNQQFLILENRQMEELEKKVSFSFWEQCDESHTVVRFATTWSTTREDLRGLREALEQLCTK